MSARNRRDLENRELAQLAESLPLASAITAQLDKVWKFSLIVHSTISLIGKSSLHSENISTLKFRRFAAKRIS